MSLCAAKEEFEHGASDALVSCFEETFAAWVEDCCDREAVRVSKGFVLVNFACRLVQSLQYSYIVYPSWCIFCKASLPHT